MIISAKRTARGSAEVEHGYAAMDHSRINNQESGIRDRELEPHFIWDPSAPSAKEIAVWQYVAVLSAVLISLPSGTILSCRNVYR